MHESHHHQHAPVATDGQHVPGKLTSYWRRAHRDGRFWLGFFLMVAAIAFYVSSGNLTFMSMPGRQRQQPASDSTAK